MVADSLAIRRFGVAGYPVAHSRSPQIHEAAYAALEIAATYQRLPIPPELFADTVTALPASGYSGINVTIPHKAAALALADEASAAASAIGAANTLTFAEGKIVADNTDAPALVGALGIEDPANGRSALVLGAGGTARAAVWALLSVGVDVHVWNRTAERAGELAAELGAKVVETPVECQRPDFVINATAVGMDAETTQKEAKNTLHLDLTKIVRSAVVVDYVYRDCGSPLASAAKDAGLDVVDGLELLVRQAALSFEIWFGRPAPLEAMRSAALAR